MKTIGYAVGLLVITLILAAALGGAGIVIGMLGLSVYGGVMTVRAKSCESREVAEESNPIPDNVPEIDTEFSKLLATETVTKLRNRRKDLLAAIGQSDRSTKYIASLQTELDQVRIALKVKEQKKQPVTA